MGPQNDTRTIAEINDLIPERVGDFVRAPRFDGAGTGRVAAYVYEPEHDEESPSGWALILCRRRDDVWLDVFRWSATKSDYISLREIADNEDVGDDVLEEMVELSEVILRMVSEKENPDLLSTINLSDVEEWRGAEA